MLKPKVHVALLGKQKTIEHIAIRRSIDELVLVYSREKLDIADNLINQFSNLGIAVIPVRVVQNDFTNVLSSILRALDHRKLDDYQVEFSMTSGQCVMTLAACVAAAIVKASVIYVSGSELFEISEVWPSEMVNLTHKKCVILDYLETHDSPVQQKEISKYTGIRQSGVSRHLRDLEMAGYVRRTRKARNKQVQITELGSTILHHKQIRKRRLWNSYSSRTLESIQTVG
jgi:DNA-binding MarR family transcriptional regulator